MPAQRALEAMPFARATTTRGGGAALVAIALAHLIGCFYYFPPHEMLSGEPAMTSDYVVHYLDAESAAQNLKSGSFLGYSTRWAAGAPSGFPALANNRPFAILLAVVPDGYAPLAFNLALFAALWITPLLTFGAARAGGADRSAAAATTLFFLAAWYGSTLFRVFWRGGSVLFLLGTTLGLWIGLRLPSVWRRSSGAFSTALPIALVAWVHSLAAIVVVIVGSFAWFDMAREERPSLRRLLATAAAVILLCAPWLCEFVASSPLRRSLDYGIYLGGLGDLWFDLTQSVTREPWRTPEATILCGVLLAALVGELVCRDSGGRRRALWLAALSFGALAYGARYLTPLRVLQPYRFVLPLIGLLALLAGPLATARWRGRPVALLGALVALLLLADRVRIGFLASDYIAAGLGDADRWALEALRSLAAPQGKVEGRILAEGDWRAEPVPGRRGVRVSYAYVGLSRVLDAEFIGAPAMATGLRAEFASFWKGSLFGRPIAQWSAQDLRGLCDLYDIRWVVSAREDTQAYLATLGSPFEPRMANGAIGIFEVERQDSRVLRGSGHASSDGREIEFQTDVAAPAVLKYHWAPALRAEPDAGLRSIEVIPGAPVGFIEITPPRPGRYRIRWQSSWTAAIGAVDDSR